MITLESRNVVINNAPAVGLLAIVAVPNLGAANSGTYQNITVQYPNPSCCNGSPIGIELLGDASGTLVRGIDDIKLSACTLGASGSGSTGAGIYISGVSTKIVNSSIECYQTGIQIDNAGDVPTQDVQIDNAHIRCTALSTGSGCATSQGDATGYGITLASGTAHISLSSISGIDASGAPLKNLIQYYNGATIATPLSGPFQGFFMLGESTEGCTPAPNCLALISTDSTVQWLVPFDFSKP